MSENSPNAVSATPIVTVAIPMLNEFGAIDACLDSFSSQDYPTELLDILVIDGGSTDGSREYVDQRSSEQPWIRVIDNPAGSAAAAFNLGAFEGRGEIVCLFSSHGVPAASYVSRSVEVLLETGVVGVGGSYYHLGTTPQSSAIGAAMVSPFGMASGHRISAGAAQRERVDTISHPAYVRQALVDIGGFDESLARNSDYEINVRLREAGHQLLLDPSIESVYRPRPNLKALGRQFWHYGRWKARVAKQHPSAVKPRHLVAPAMAAGTALTPLAIAASRATRLATGAAWGTYAALAVAATVTARSSARATRSAVGFAEGTDVSTPTLAAAFPTMHLAWGTGFVVSMVEDLLGPVDRPVIESVTTSSSTNPITFEQTESKAA